MAALLPRTRTLLTSRRRWRNRVSVRRRASGRVHYNYYRDYEPTVGRYSQSDPIGLRGGLNTYLYAMASPVTLDDPRGLNAGVRYGVQGAGIGIGAALACAFNPDLCRTIIKLVCEDIVSFVTDDRHEDCKSQWIDDTKWCDNNFTGRKNIACHRWAEEEFERCRKGNPREPFRI